MPWQEAPAFYQSLDDKSLPQLALRLLMLTGLLSYPVRHAHLVEIDGDIWTIPGEKMKGRKGKTAWLSLNAACVADRKPAGKPRSG